MNFTDWLILNQYNGDIVKAIESLRPSTDYVKDYIFPVAIAFASAFLVGYLLFILTEDKNYKRLPETI